MTTKKKHAHKADILDLHTARSQKMAIYAAVLALVVFGLLIRKAFLPATNGDYQIFASWYDFARTHGVASLKYGAESGFSNYNPTYNYFLIVAALLHIPKLIAIKGLMVVFDILLATATYMVAKQLGQKKRNAIFIALGTTFLPTVLATGALWGQFDQFYTAFVVMSLWAVLAERSKLAWLFFGIAVSIKLQAIFFLPVLVIMIFKKIRWQDAWTGVASFSVLTFFPVLFGRSFSSLVHIYGAQTSLFSGHLQLSAPNIYVWLPNEQFAIYNKAGIYWTMATLAILFIYALYRRTFSDKSIVLLTVLSLYMVPFLLPQMHERYFFSATAVALLVLLVSKRLWWAMILMQIVTLFSYTPFWQVPVPFFIALPLFGIIIISALCYEYISSNERKIAERT